MSMIERDWYKEHYQEKRQKSNSQPLDTHQQTNYQPTAKPFRISIFTIIWLCLALILSILYFNS